MNLFICDVAPTQLLDLSAKPYIYVQSSGAFI